METITNDINISAQKLEQVLNELKINYGKIDLDDGDINYIINFSSENAKLISIRELNTIEGLIFIDAESRSLNFIVINIYLIKDQKNINYYYELVNEVNGIINHGKFTIYKDPYRIIYRAVVDYDNTYDIFSKDLLQSIVDDFLDNLSVFYVILKKRGIDKNV